MWINIVNNYNLRHMNPMKEELECLSLLDQISVNCQHSRDE